MRMTEPHANAELRCRDERIVVPLMKMRNCTARFFCCSRDQAKAKCGRRLNVTRHKWVCCKTSTSDSLRIQGCQLSPSTEPVAAPSADRQIRKYSHFPSPTIRTTSDVLPVALQMQIHGPTIKRKWGVRLSISEATRQSRHFLSWKPN